MWHDPETNSRLFMYRTNWNQTMKVYQEITPGQWVLYNQFNSPLPAPFKFITSPEPFTCGGHSYISFMAAQSGSGKDGLPAQIWIAGANPADAFMRCVSDTSVAIRVDPEPVVFSDSAYIYYTYVPTDKKTTNQYLVRKCNTGLGNLYTSIDTKNTTITPISAFPNPSSGSINLRTPSIFGTGSAIEIYNLKGSLVLSKLAESTTSVIDLSPFPEGKYIIKIRKQGKEATTSVTLAR
ncbi:MAG: T9SS type A sorting domain-containing protein, partial [Bacteroidota bacterium]